jgi:hypothetical protein
MSMTPSPIAISGLRPNTAWHIRQKTYDDFSDLSPRIIGQRLSDD